MKILLTLFVLFFSSSVLAKEYKSIHGFKINIPDDYIVVTSNNFNEVIDIIKNIVDFDMDYWNESVIPGLTNQNVEFLFNTDNFNNINFVSVKKSYIEINKNILPSLCPAIKKGLSELVKRDGIQINCNISSIPGIMGKSIYVEHYDFLPGATTFQFMFYTDYENLVYATLTCFYEDCVKSKLVFEDILFSIIE
jgi:hypothetical protein